MSNFSDIPIKDINYIINKYNLTWKDKYLTVWNFIINNSNILVPTSVADWIIAYNNKNIGTYNSEILTNKINNVIF